MHTRREKACDIAIELSNECISLDLVSVQQSCKFLMLGSSINQKYLETIDLPVLLVPIIELHHWTIVSTFSNIGPPFYFNSSLLRSLFTHAPTPSLLWYGAKLDLEVYSIWFSPHTFSMGI